MALKATIFKADLQIADMDRHYYHSHALTIARHPSETDERMMLRLLAFARHADEALVFAKGLSDTDEPDIWLKDLTGSIKLWVEVGQPDEKRILKACGRSEQVAIYAYSGNGAGIWWNQIAPKLQRLSNLTVVNILPPTSIELSKLAQRNMELQCTIQDEEVWMAGDEGRVQVDFTVLKAPQ